MLRRYDGDPILEELTEEEDFFPIPEELQPYISLEKLKENRANYPEWQRELTEKETQQVRIIMKRLLCLPLIHCSRNDNLAGVISHRDSAELAVQANTYPLDQSLGLDNYVFLTWGMGDWARYGQHVYCFDTQILFEPGTIVTPGDVVHAAGWQNSTPFEELGDRDREGVQDMYFDKMLTGRDWFYVIAIRILEDLKRRKKIIPIAYSAFGEIKVFRELPFGPFDEYHGRKQMEYGIQSEGKPSFYQRYLYDNGFAYINIMDDMRRIEEGQRVSSVDPLPNLEDWQKLKHSWDEIVNS